jgi:hypothetical protein
MFEFKITDSQRVFVCGLRTISHDALYGCFHVVTLHHKYQTVYLQVQQWEGAPSRCAAAGAAPGLCKVISGCVRSGDAQELGPAAEADGERASAMSDQARVVQLRGSFSASGLQAEGPVAPLKA